MKSITHDLLPGLEGYGAGRSVACIEEEGCIHRLTPGEAEERAGLGSNKNWKKTILVSHCVRVYGDRVTLLNQETPTLCDLGYVLNTGRVDWTVLAPEEPCNKEYK